MAKRVVPFVISAYFYRSLEQFPRDDENTHSCARWYSRFKRWSLDRFFPLPPVYCHTVDRTLARIYVGRWKLYETNGKVKPRLAVRRVIRRRGAARRTGIPLHAHAQLKDTRSELGADDHAIKFHVFVLHVRFIKFKKKEKRRRNHVLCIYNASGVK